MITSLYRLVGTRDLRKQNEADAYLQKLWAARVRLKEWRRAQPILCGRSSTVRP